MTTLAKTNVRIRKLDAYSQGELERNPDDRWITMGNALIRSGQALTLAEKRLVALATSKIDSSKPMTMERLSYVLTAKEYAQQFQVDESTAYKLMAEGATRLFERKFTCFLPDHLSKKVGEIKKQGRWVFACDYNKRRGTVTLGFSPDVVPYLTNLKEHFTSYKLGQVSSLRSIYSWRLLELLEQFKKNKWAEYTLKDFHLSMDATEAQKKDFATVRRRMIEPAIKELESKEGWLIRWKPIKEGRKVVRLRFEFEHDPQLKLI